MLSYNAPHVPLFPSKQFRGHSLGGLYADVVEELDWSVGRVMAVVRDLRLDDRTLVVFTSDNGPMDLFGRYGGSAGGLRGGKGTTWEGGMRVPGIFWGPAFVKAGVEHGIGSQLDLLPTIAELTRQALPAGRVLDGQSLLATLESGAPSPRTTLPYYRNGGVYALRMGAIKAHFVTEGVYGAGEPLTRHEPPLFFDLSQDISERSPLEDTSPDVQAKLQAARRLLEQTVRPAPSQLTKGLPPVSGEK
jgi:arylsulfatase A-like enzyme